MITVRVLAFSVAAVAATASTTYAGPCSDQIDAVQARIDARLEAKAAAGPTAKQGVAAGMSMQPTPRSIESAEEKLGDISPQTVAAVGQAMARARAADSAGDNSGCEQALAEAQRAIGP
ncbi:MAG: hypothetical protein J2P55_07810 [Rhizobiales bacterium]|nr:hypothetical protein [Hyphomicrobiales bacterium]